MPTAHGLLFIESVWRKPQPDDREQALAEREALVAARERASKNHEAGVCEREEALTDREEVMRLREEALQARIDVEEARAKCELLLVQVREVNAKLVVATVRADELVDQARANDRAKDDFLAMLGHELRNPLAPIVAALDLMEVIDGHVFPRERAIIQRQVTHLVRLVDDLLDVSRITRGKVELQCEPIDLAVVVRRAIEMHRPLVEEKSHHLIVQLGEHLTVNGDATRLAQAIGNLISNAAKYTPDAGTIEVRGERSGSKVVLRIRDTGIGISAELLPRIFEPFTQERQADGGLGLGLAIAQRLVAMHDGTLSARSDGLGRGTELVIELPACDDVRAAPVPVEDAADAELLGLHVLVVDDNHLAAELLGMLLPVFGCEVRIAFDGPSALEVAREFVPDVALLDIGLPGMDGYDLASELRAALPDHDVHFIAITGYGQEDDVRRSRSAGFEAHLVKPVEAARLAQTLREVARSAHA